MHRAIDQLHDEHVGTPAPRAAVPTSTPDVSLSNLKIRGDSLLRRMIRHFIESAQG